MSTCGARFQTKTRCSEGRVVRGDATTTSKEKRCLLTFHGARKEMRTISGRSEAHVHRRDDDVKVRGILVSGKRVVRD